MMRPGRNFSIRAKPKGKWPVPNNRSRICGLSSRGGSTIWGRRIGRGAVWLDDPVRVDEPSEAFLFGGFAIRGVHLAHRATEPAAYKFEVDRGGVARWEPLAEVSVPASGYVWHPFPAAAAGEWIRVRCDTAGQATAWFEMRNPDSRVAHMSQDEPRLPGRFAGLSFADGAEHVGGLVRAGKQGTGLKILATRVEGGASKPNGYYELKPDSTLARVESQGEAQPMARKMAIPTGILQVDGCSILYTDDNGRRFRLPVGNPVFLDRPELMDLQRTSREVVTERDLFHCAGTFFELPARNAGGFAKIRPIATHPLFVQDFCSWRGLLVLTGTTTGAGQANPHLVRSADGNCQVWLGAVDDLWGLGKPAGRGGPWTATPVQAHQPSDPYLLAGYDRKRVTLSHTAERAVQFLLEVDISGTENWNALQSLTVPAGEAIEYEFPAGFAAYWVRLAADRQCEATAQFVYQ